MQIKRSKTSHELNFNTSSVSLWLRLILVDGLKTSLYLSVLKTWKLLFICLIWINFPFIILFCITLRTNWFMDTSTKKCCSRRCFLKLTSETALFCRIVFDSASGIQHPFKLIFFSFIIIKYIIKEKIDGWGSLFVWLQ